MRETKDVTLFLANRPKEIAGVAAADFDQLPAPRNRNAFEGQDAGCS